MNRKHWTTTLFFVHWFVVSLFCFRFRFGCRHDLLWSHGGCRWRDVRHMPVRIDNTSSCQNLKLRTVPTSSRTWYFSGQVEGDFLLFVAVHGGCWQVAAAGRCSRRSMMIRRNEIISISIMIRRKMLDPGGCTPTGVEEVFWLWASSPENGIAIDHALHGIGKMLINNNSHYVLVHYHSNQCCQRIVFMILNDDSFTLSGRIVDSAILAKTDNTPPLDNPVLVVLGRPPSFLPSPTTTFCSAVEVGGGGGGKSDLEIWYKSSCVCDIIDKEQVTTDGHVSRCFSKTCRQSFTMSFP